LIPDAFEGRWPKAEQEVLSRRVCEMIGYDFRRGRLDVSAHPFSAGGAHDARITTRYDESTPIPSLLGSVHEAGHAMYMQGLPPEHLGTPLGDARDLVVHESQSRLWENHVGRSLGFWERVTPMVRELFPANKRAFDPVACWKSVNDARPTLIRVEADEGTYNMHVMVRFELERALFRGDLQPRDLPREWNRRYKDYLGIDVPDDRRGCMQDVHWSFGLIGYFPTYTLGNLYAAQFWEKITADIDDLPKQIGKGQFDALLHWLRENIHRHGKRYRAADLCRRVTGKALSADPLVEHLTRKAEQVYGI